MRHQSIIVLSNLLFLTITITAQPSPGDLFKEYSWFNESGDCNGALRVGGRFDYRVIEQADDYFGNGLIQPPFDIDLENALKAELILEKMLCHGGTEGLRVSINGHEPLLIPESAYIPEPQSAYAHHYNAVIPVDLSMLRSGTNNTFLFQVDTTGHRWPQNLIYGLILRIYKDQSGSGGRTKIIFPSEGAILGETSWIRLEIPEEEKISRIDLVGYYLGPDLDGDGRYTQWHYGYHQCSIYSHIGTLTSPPYELNWDMGWIPDQEESVRLAAFIHREDGNMYMTEAVGGLELNRTGVSVELCMPYELPKGWFTREGSFSQKFDIKGDPGSIAEAKMVFRTWSPGYFNGIYINDFLVFIREGPRYDYFEHHIPVDEAYAFQKGVNTLATGKTPLYQCEMVHGVEVQWPGIMLLIRYEKK